MEDACRQVQVQCSWSSSAHLVVCVPLRLREPACGVAFTGAGLLLVESVEGFPITVLCPFLVAVALPSRLRCIAWLPCVLVRFLRTVFCCPGESFSQDCSVLISAIAVLPQGLRYAASVGLAGAFWRVFPERCLRGSGGGSPMTDLCCFCSPTVVLPLWFEVCRSVGLHSGEVLPGRLLALFGGGSPQSCLVFSAALVGLRVPVAWMVCFISCALRALPDGGLVSVVGVWLAVLLVEARECCFAVHWFFVVGLLVQALFRCMLGGASACVLEAFHVVVLVFGLSIGLDRGGASCSCALES
ncbi:hypothetical protein Taro_034336 [Colocasia esculenta]|uniref:Transmembrane protein n=1 Tax=Colocasia esculenta TaxID=4460 RepID=A0A843W3T1_COLES|nr:hypothetical protein [Colocasia esculenta]